MDSQAFVSEAEKLRQQIRDQCRAFEDRYPGVALRIAYSPALLLNRGGVYRGEPPKVTNAGDATIELGFWTEQQLAGDR